MNDQIQYGSVGKTFIITVAGSFTLEIIEKIREIYESTDLSLYQGLDFQLEKVSDIDSSGIGFLLELHRRLKIENPDAELTINVKNNQNLKTIFQTFKIDQVLIIS